MSDNQNQNQGSQQDFKIQPHPATTNDPRDLAGGALGGQGGANVFNTPGIQQVPSGASLEQPKSREELQAETAKLNK